jgi:hypothetical protein
MFVYSKNMKLIAPVDNQIESHILDKRNEIIWALELQKYTYAQIGRMFNLHRATVMRICKGRPATWKVKWVKA